MGGRRGSWKSQKSTWFEPHTYLIMTLSPVLRGFTVALLSQLIAALQNGAALTPPMGWLSWQRYGCTVACDNATAKDCFNEKLIRDTADALVSEGYKDAGYEVS